MTKLDSKGAKRSLNVRATNFYKIFFKNVLLYMNGGLSKMCSLHTYVRHRMFYFERYCTKTNNTMWKQLQSVETNSRLSFHHLFGKEKRAIVIQYRWKKPTKYGKYRAYSLKLGTFTYSFSHCVCTIIGFFEV